MDRGRRIRLAEQGRAADWYTTYPTTHWPRSLADADTLRFDASDPMVADVGAGTFWQGMVDWVPPTAKDTEGLRRHRGQLARGLTTRSMGAAGVGRRTPAADHPDRLEPRGSTGASRMTTTVPPSRVGRRLVLAVAGLAVLSPVAGRRLPQGGGSHRPFPRRLYDLVGWTSRRALMEQYGLDPTPKLVMALSPWWSGIAGIWALFFAHARRRASGSLDGRRPPCVRAPGRALLGFYLVFPAVRTLFISVTDRPDGGLLDNYGCAFTSDREPHGLRNNILWLVLGTGGSVPSAWCSPPWSTGSGGRHWPRRSSSCRWRSRWSAPASSGGSCTPGGRPGQPQIGFLNAVMVGAGGEPVPGSRRRRSTPSPLIVIMVWLQVGFAMVVLSAAIKGVPTDVLEAARIDGASELRSSSDRRAADQGHR